MKSRATSRSASLRRWLTVVVALIFAIKALIPPGYMLASVAVHSRLVMCPAGLYEASGMHPIAGMVHASGVDHGEHASRSADQCPFALAGGAAFFASDRAPAAPQFVTVGSARARAPSSVPIPPPSRYHAPRGPPFLA